MRPKANEMPSRSAPVIAGRRIAGEDERGDDRTRSDEHEQGGAQRLGERTLAEGVRAPSSPPQRDGTLDSIMSNRVSRNVLPRRRASQAAAASTSRGDHRGGVGPRQAARRGGHLGQPLRGRRAARRPRPRSRCGRELRVGQDRRGAGLGHPARVGGLVVGGRVRIRDQDRRQAVLGELEHRAAGAGDREVGGDERLPERRDVFAQVVVRAGRSQLGEVARTGHVEDVVVGVGERLDRRQVDRARAERAAEDQHAGRLRRDAELGAGGRAVVDRRRDGAAGDEVAVAVAAGDREGEADAAGARREQAVGEAEVGVGLGEHDAGCAA